MPAAAIYSLVTKKENAHEDPIYCCAWTKINTQDDGKGPSKEFILSGGLDGLVKIWSFENNQLRLLHTLAGHSMAVVSIAVSPDGHSVATTSIDSSLIIWDLLSGQKVHEIETGATDVWKVVFSPDGSQVATGTHTGKIMIYGIKNGTTDRVLDTRGKFVLSVDWSPDNMYIASGSVDGTVCVFDVVQGKLIHTIEAHRHTVRHVKFSPDSRLIASASDDGTVKFHTAANAVLHGTVEHKGAVGVAYSPDCKCVASSATDGSVRIAQLDVLYVLHTFHEHADTVWGIQYNEKGDRLLSISKDKCINIYECPMFPKCVKK